MITATQRNLVTARLQADVDKINAHYNTNFAAPRVAYDIRGGSCAGRITSRDNWSVIHLNPGLFVDNADAQINETAPHELAHWAEWKIHGEWEDLPSGKRSVHGRRWKEIMAVLGVAAERTASGMNMENVKVKKKKKYHYVCEGRCKGDLTLSSVAHNRIVRRTHSYSCSRCGGSIKLKKALGQVTYQEAREARTSQDRPKRPTAPQAPKAPATGSKKARAQDLYDTYKQSHNRASIIRMFMDDLDMSQAGANTYWYNLVK